MACCAPPRYQNLEAPETHRPRRPPCPDISTPLPPSLPRHIHNPAPPSLRRHIHIPTPLPVRHIHTPAALPALANPHPPPPFLPRHIYTPPGAMRAPASGWCTSMFAASCPPPRRSQYPMTLRPSRPSPPPNIHSLAFPHARRSNDVLQRHHAGVICPADSRLHPQSLPANYAPKTPVTICYIHP